MKARKSSKAKPVVNSKSKAKSKAPPPKAVAAKKPVRIVKPAPKPAPKKKGASEAPAASAKAAKRPAKPVKTAPPKRERAVSAIKSAAAAAAAAKVQVAEELEVVSDVLELEEPVLTEAEEAALAEEPAERSDAPLFSDISEIQPREEGDESAALAETEAQDQTPTEAPATRAHLKRVLESLVFVAESAITPLQLGRIVKAKQAEVREVLLEIAREYEGRGIELVEVSGGFQFRSAAASAPFVRDLVAHRPVRLTRAQLETLALIAYRQPITRPEIDDVRGVDSGSAIKVLLDRDLVKILGRKDEAGRPLLYGTAPQFLDFFGMKTLQDLPTLREFTELSEENRELFQRKMGEVPDLSDPSNIPHAAPSDYADVEDGGAESAEARGDHPAPEPAPEPAVADAEAADAEEGEAKEDDAELRETNDAERDADDDDEDDEDSEQDSDEDEDEDSDEDDEDDDVEDSHADEDEDDDRDEDDDDDVSDEDSDEDEDDSDEDEDSDLGDSDVEDVHDSDPDEIDDDSDEDADEDEDADDDADSDEVDDESDIDDSSEPDEDDDPDPSRHR